MVAFEKPGSAAQAPRAALETARRLEQPLRWLEAGFLIKAGKDSA
jgi:hypothetical protein